ncbi:hypothetical protein K492DRAFT_211651 [Lichtheimia hyalospora FSU 10163]|nr:hypothetical protein K492DRAFT_211651 [Lichtheimia hyalospora FSU 10163]
MIETRLDTVCPEQPAITINDPSWHERVKDQNMNVQDCLQKLLSALNARASLLADGAQLDGAMSDATAMMSIAPTSPLGYLLAGRIFSFRGQHASAAKIYDKALGNVPTTYPGYQQFATQRATANDIINKRVDFISKLPLDVVIQNIIPRVLGNQTMFDIDRPSHYFDVCRTWRQRMAIVDGLHFELGPAELSEDAYERVSDIAPFIRTLHVAQRNYDILSEVNKRTRFGSLKSLSIQDSTREPDQLLASLRSFAMTLTNLELGYVYNGIPENRYRLCDIVDTFPNLVSVRMAHGDIDMSSVTKSYPKLIKLDLYESTIEVNQGNISSLLRPLPQLRVLKLFPVSGSDILPIIDEYCPLLEHLILSDRSFSHPSTEVNTGLRVLSLSPAGEFKENDVVHYLLNHSDTIETFDAGDMEAFSRPADLRHQAIAQDVTFKRLRQIDYLSTLDDSFISFITWMIQRAPYLESVETVQTPFQSTIFQELIRSNQSHLKRVGLQAIHADTSEEEHFIRHHLELGQHSSLKELKIDIERGLHNLWFALIPQLSQLTTIEIRADMLHKRHKIRALMGYIARGCPALEQFVLSTTSSSITYQDLYPMQCHKNLKRIFINTRNISGDPFAFRKRFKHLESIHLSLTIVDWTHIWCLEKGRFQVVLTPFSFTSRSYYSE